MLTINSQDLKTSTDKIHSLIMEGAWPIGLREEIERRLTSDTFSDRFVAVRSSGTDEDSASHSFAGTVPTIQIWSKVHG